LPVLTHHPKEEVLMKARSGRYPFRRFGIALLCLSATSLSYSSDLDKEVNFHIGPRPLESALLEFSREADVQVAMASASIRDVKVAGVQGKYPIGTALVILLRGSGLSYTVVGSTLTVTEVP
jgi:iron complex outermembrane receptor protein